MKKILFCAVSIVLLVACAPSLEESYSSEAKKLSESLHEEIRLYDEQWIWLNDIKEVIGYDIVRQMSPHFDMVVPGWVNSRYKKWKDFAEIQKRELLSDTALCREKHLKDMEKFLDVYGKIGMSNFLKTYRLEKGHDLSRTQREFCDSMIQVVIEKYPVPKK